MVVSNPTKLNVSGDYITSITNESINAGSILQGGDTLPYRQLTVGFNSNSNLVFGHHTNDLNVPLSRSSDFRLITLRFNTADGMKAFINDNQTPLSEDANLYLPLLSNNNLKLKATSLGGTGNGNTRTQVVEIRAYNVALTDFDRQLIAKDIIDKYGL